MKGGELVMKERCQGNKESANQVTAFKEFNVLLKIYVSKCVCLTLLNLKVSV